jgi:uncharacterized membrane protein
MKLYFNKTGTQGSVFRFRATIKKMTSFIGHLHPLLVHLPIGVLLLAFVLECMARWFQQDQVRPAIRMAIGLGLAAAILSAVSGWLLAEAGDYSETVLQRHRWLGVGTAGLFSLVWLAQRSRWYFPLFTAGIITLVAAGHYGGNLTHGEGYLFETTVVATSSARGEAIVLGPETIIFKDIIQPILQEKCVSCHRPAKRKGDLILSTEAGIMAGGKHGKVLLPGHPDSSNMLQRIYQPLHHDDHMPPSGKPQLSALEIHLLEWWIKEGAEFQSLVKDHPLPEELSAAINAARPAPSNPVFLKSVPMPSAKDLERLKSLHISVRSLEPGQPWLAVSLAGQRSFPRTYWDALNAVSAQLVDLDLSHTAVQDQDLSGKAFPNLVRLNIAHTSLGNGAIPFLSQSPFLESINLTNTLMGNELQVLLPKLPHLKKLFLWQTQITPELVSSWKTQYPDLQFETGANIPDDAPLTLRMPKLLYARSFFDDTMQLELDFPFKGVDIYYTLDEAASPTTQSFKYKEKIVLDKTSHLRAFATKAGWENSPITEAVFVKKKFSIASAILEKLPSPKYPAKGASSLIDGKIADAQGADTWLGFEGDHIATTLDLGQTREIGHVFVHCLENNSPWIFRPVGLQVFTSVDGKVFTPQASEKFAPNSSMGEQKVHLLGAHFMKPTNARFVKVRVESPLKNPPWHPGKGQKCWIFVDEIMVE